MNAGKYYAYVNITRPEICCVGRMNCVLLVRVVVLHWKRSGQCAQNFQKKLFLQTNRTVRCDCFTGPKKTPTDCTTARPPELGGPRTELPEYPPASYREPSRKQRLRRRAHHATHLLLCIAHQNGNLLPAQTPRLQTAPKLSPKLPRSHRLPRAIHGHCVSHAALTDFCATRT